MKCPFDSQGMRERVEAASPDDAIAMSRDRMLRVLDYIEWLEAELDAKVNGEDVSAPAEEEPAWRCAEVAGRVEEPAKAVNLMEALRQSLPADWRR